MGETFGRRDLIRLAAGAALAAQARAGGQPKFLTPEEFTLLDELTEVILPADAQSGGARAAGVAEYIDGRLAEAFEQSERDAWRGGLARVNALSHEMHGQPFRQCTPAARTAVVTRMAANEGNPQAVEEKFFRELKSMTVFAYYTSPIGIHDDMGYRGNVFQQGEYAGELPGRTTVVSGEAKPGEAQ